MTYPIGKPLGGQQEPSGNLTNSHRLMLLDDKELHVLRAATAAFAEQLEVWCRMPLATEQHVDELLALRRVQGRLWLVDLM
jgi:hypothetical protein